MRTRTVDPKQQSCWEISIEIAGQYGLSIASVYAAMAYYFDHREEIDLRTEREETWVEAFSNAILHACRRN